MSENPAWRCGHPKTDENTTCAGRCRECHNEYHRAYNKANYAEASRIERYERHRMAYLPRQIAQTEHKLTMLRREAARYGMHDLTGNQA